MDWEVFRFRIRTGDEIRSITGHILSWRDGMVEIMDLDQKQRTVHEARIVKMVRIDKRRKNLRVVYQGGEQLDIYQFLKEGI